MTADVRSENLPPRQMAAVRSLLAGGTTSEAATAERVTERTIRRWVTNDVFHRALREAARHVARESVGALLAAQGEAVATLRAALRSGLPAVRVRAAVALLDLGRTAADDDLESRVADIEERQASLTRSETGWPPELRVLTPR